jgi:hypothetical protein
VAKILINAGPSERGWHRIETFLCPRRYAYRYLLGFDDGSRCALVLGSLVHIVLAHHYIRRKRGVDVALYYTPEEALIEGARVLGAEPDQIKAAGEIYRNYVATWGQEAIEVLNVEEQFEALLREKWRFTMRFDLVFRDAAKKIWIIDHKTTSAEVNKRISRIYTMSGQILMMQVMGRGLWGNAFGGVRLNLIQSRAPYKLLRDSPDPAPTALGGVVARICDAEEGIARLQASGLPPLEWPMATSEHLCFMRYGECAYFDRCRWGS